MVVSKAAPWVVESADWTVVEWAVALGLWMVGESAD